MRITRETLLKIARDTAAQRVRASRRLVSAYLTGSLLGDDPLIGGTADIDLVFIHDSEPPVRREIVGLVEPVHLDIAHYSQAEYSQPRRLRQDPWLGPYITAHPLLLHDSAHWFDFTQAAVTAQFSDPENILARAQTLATSARQAWLELRLPAAGGGSPTPPQLWRYLKALEEAGNAFASLTGAPMAERRFWDGLPERAAALGRPGLAAGLADLLLPAPLSAETWQSWQAPWRDALASAAADPACPPRLHAARRDYYLRAAAALFESQPAASAWLALRTWTQAALLPSGTALLDAWRATLPDIGMAGEGFASRLDSFDAYLDSLEETLDIWAKDNGI